MNLDLFNETKTHFVTWINSSKYVVEEEHNLKKLGSLWVSDQKSDMYRPCVSCYFYHERGKTPPSKIGGRVTLFAVFKKLDRFSKSYHHICKKCLENEPIEFLEVSFDWFQAKSNQRFLNSKKEEFELSRTTDDR